jgi:tetratricopeptide (TPR) repeat protein
LGNLPRAVDEVKRTLEIYPKDFVSRYNYAMYSMYAGDFATSAAEGERVLKESPSFAYALLPIALSNLARGDVPASTDALSRLAQLGPDGESLASLARADLELYFGLVKRAAGILRGGIAADEKRGSTGETAQKHVALAEAYLALGQPRQAAESALRAAALSNHEGVLFPAARVLVSSGREEQAEKIAVTLENMLQRQTVAYARIIQGEIAIKRGRLALGMEALREGQKRQDSWMSRFVSGRAYFDAGHYPEALAEFELCLKRRGEAADAFFRDTPTLRYFPPVYYWLARTQESLGVTAEAKKNYEQFLALRRETDTPDPLAADAQRRLRAASSTN